jgi:heme/copper-type cytochrome/quinol oxidase subunit 2
MFRIVGIAILATVLSGISCETAMACPTCKSALHNGLALGYAISILFMMAMPFLIFTFWIVTIFRLRATTNDSNPAIHESFEIDTLEG